MPGIHPESKRLQMIFRVFVICICLFSGSIFITAAHASSEKVTLQLAWKHQFQFAGYYAALHKGFYRDAGLDVTIVEGGEGRFAREEVLSGNARYGVTGAELILHRADGDPLVVLAAIFQHSASVILTRADDGIAHPQDLIGRRLMLLPENKDADILAIFQNEGIPMTHIRRMDQTYSLRDLIEGRTDAVSAYVTNEPWHLEEAGMKPGIILPQTYGVDFYGDCLFTTEQEIQDHPDRVRLFRESSLRGWDYAMNHQDEIINLLIREYKVAKGRDHLRYEARTMESLIFPKLVEMGHMNPGRWRHIADTFAGLGELPVNFSLDGFIYDPNPKPDIRKLKFALLTVLAGLIAVSLLSFVFISLNRKLKKEVLEREITEKSLRTSESQKEAILNGITANIAYVDENLKILWVNKTAAASAGKQPEEMIGHVCHEFWGCPDVPCKNCPTIKAFRTRQPEHTIMHTPYGRIWDERGEPVFDGDGNLTGVVEIAQDITESRMAEEKLRESETRLRIVFDASRAGIILMNDQGVITFANQGLSDMFKCPLEEIISTNYLELVHDDHRSTAELSLRQLIAGGRNTASEERHYQRPDGTDFWGFLSGKRHEDERGNLISLVVIIADITERKEMEHELRQAHKMESIGTLTGGVAHDFNNILGVIIGNAELALDDIPEWNSAYSNLIAIKTAGLRAAGIVKQLLNYSRKTDLELKPIDAVSELRDAVKFLRSTIPSNIEMRSNLPEAEISILADPVQINQVLMNLCSNASHEMEETGGILKINVGKETLNAVAAGRFPELEPGDYLRISVSDTGGGIAPEIIDRIFDPYFTTREIGKGSGMGLAVVLGIVKNHGGTVTASSPPGSGAVFTILLPVVSERPEPEIKPHEEMPTGSESILFVDDEAFITEMSRLILERLGYTVEARMNPVEALEVFRSDPDSFDLVVSDMTMPEMTGVKLFEQIREIRKDIPVIICTGHSSLMDEEKAVELGIDAFVMKPITKTEIARTIREVLESAENARKN